MNIQTEKIKRKYNRIANVFDFVDHMILPSWRKQLIGSLKGNILEVGVGTGANLTYYHDSANVVGIDFSPNMLKKAAEKIENGKIKTGATITLKEMDIEKMAFPDDTFDYVVSTCVFCSVPRPINGLKEIRRVLKPTGKLVMLEHMRSQNRVVGKLLDVANPISVFMSGVNINRQTIENIEKAGLKINEETYLMTSIMRKLIVLPNK